MTETDVTLMCIYHSINRGVEYFCTHHDLKTWHMNYKRGHPATDRTYFPFIYSIMPLVKAFSKLCQH